jgi:hypothetical protein
VHLGKFMMSPHELLVGVHALVSHEMMLELAVVALPHVSSMSFYFTLWIHLGTFPSREENPKNLWPGLKIKKILRPSKKPNDRG